MGCTACSTNKGKPSGCQSNGGCSSGGCNRLNVHDWLANLPFHDPAGSCRVAEITFSQGSRKEFFRNNALHVYSKGDLVAVESQNGYDVGTVNLTGELVRLQLKKRGVAEDSQEIKKILRRASDIDIQRWKEQKAKEPEAMVRARAIARQLKLNMKLSEVEFQADGRKATFFYTADDRVDFRELIKIYASEFKVKVEMKQIGARQESAKVGGIGSCGRELCCSSWLTEFKSVTTTLARYQNLSINQTKLSGQCGRLKCCLNYELDTYLDALQQFPDHAEVLETTRGRAQLVKKDIFKGIMWYVLPDSSRQYPLTVETVRDIKQKNRAGTPVEELVVAETDKTKKGMEPEPQFVDVVGQISLRSLERNSQKRRNRDRGEGSRDGGREKAPGQGQPQGDGNRNRGEGNRGRGPQQPGQQNPGRQGGGNRNPEQRNKPLNPDNRSRSEGQRGEGNRGRGQQQSGQQNSGQQQPGQQNPGQQQPGGSNRNRGGGNNRGSQPRGERRNPDQRDGGNRPGGRPQIKPERKPDIKPDSKPEA
jgi:cell fate regulator YaaT (PSP1 superfamily)